MHSWKVPGGLSQLEMQLSKWMQEESALAVNFSQRLSMKNNNRVPASQENQVVSHLGPEQELVSCGVTCLRPPCTLLANNQQDCKCGMVPRLHPWSPSCTAAALCLCWNSEHNLDCCSPRPVLPLKCSIVTLILCGRNMVCNNWGCYKGIWDREGTDVDQACRAGLKPLGKSWDVSYIASKVFCFPSLISAYCCVMWNSFYLSAVDITGTSNQCMRPVLCPQQDSTWGTCDTQMKKVGLQGWKPRAWHAGEASGQGGGASYSEGVLSSLKLRESWGMARRKSRSRAALFHIAVSTKLIF